MLITFEGIDGCGKSTQIELLGGWLREKNLEFSLFREPGGTELSEKVRHLLLDSGLQMGPVTELLLFSAARSQLISEKVIPLVERGEIVVLDRFYDSTTAYQGYGRKSAPLEQIENLNKVAAHNLVPDITFYLKITADEALVRTSAMRKDRMELSGTDFFEEVVRGFDALAKANPRFTTIDGTQSRGEIHAQIVERLERDL